MTTETTTRPAEPELVPEPEPANLAAIHDRPQPRPQVVRMDEAEAPSRVIVRMSDQVGDLFAAIAEAQKQEGYGDIERTRTARIESQKAKYQYEYETLEDVLAATRPFLAGQGVAVMQFPLPGKSTVTVRTLLGHKTGQWLSNDIACSIASTAPQDIASGITFMCRYALKAICGVAAGYDDDGAAASGAGRQALAQPAPRKSERPPSTDHVPAGHETSRREALPAQAQPAHNSQTAQSAAAAAQDPAVGRIADDGLGAKDGVTYVKLATGFRCATRDAELARALERHQRNGTAVELRCSVPKPGYAPTLIEIVEQRRAQ